MANEPIVPPTDDSQPTTNSEEPSSAERSLHEEVTALAQELVGEHNNPKYFEWYCLKIYKHGIDTIRQLQHKSRRGKYPVRLFIFLLQQDELEALKAKKSKSRSAVADLTYIPRAANDTIVLTRNDESTKPRPASGNAKYGSIDMTWVDEIFGTDGQ